MSHDSPGQSPHEQQQLLQKIIEGTATETGLAFFDLLVKNLASCLNTVGAWVTEYLPDSDRLRALSFWFKDRYVEDYEYQIKGTPCEPVVRERKIQHFPDRIIDLYPGDNDLAKLNAVSYIGSPFLNSEGEVIGHIAVLDDKPMVRDENSEAIFRIFAARASAELRRIRAEEEIKEREIRLNRVVSGAMDAIIELDSHFSISHLNPAAEALLKAPAGELHGRDFSTFLCDRSLAKIGALQDSFREREGQRKAVWVAGGLNVTTATGETLRTEASLSTYHSGGQDFHMLILRDINERIEAERRIHTLTAETEYLRAQLRDEIGFGEIIGESPAILAVLKAVQQVADTDATVLITGETGTGKELIARAVHVAGKRASKALIKVNCAAIPANLIESEFFGHEKGAFTGATARRVGRFALADGGSIFLDEVGELPLDLQSKLLRVLQEGEFEPVGSSVTQRVNVRVIAATNRNLKNEAEAGRFREDLFFRLNVFPIAVPPLRERGDDLLLLAEFFLGRIAQRMGRKVEPLDADAKARILNYRWPGNIRELQNVLERAVITAQAGRISLAGALPDDGTTLKPAGTDSGGGMVQILTAEELLKLERENICRALEARNWKVSGSDGAAALLNMKPSTLSSRMKALQIERPRA